MQKIQTFLHVFGHSLVPLDGYYKKVRTKTPFKFSFTYLFTLIFSLTSFMVVLATIYFVRLYPQQKLNNIFTTVNQSFPRDLNIVINENGRLLTNYERPFILYSKQKTNPEIVFVVDPKASPEMIKLYNTHILFTERYVVFKFNNRFIRMPYEQNHTITINREKAQSFSVKLLKVVEMYAVLTILIPLFVIAVLTCFFYVSKLVYLGFISAIIYVILQKKIKRLDLRKTYQIALHAATGPILIEYMVIILGLYVPVQIWFLVLSSVFLVAAIFEAYIDKSSST